MTETRERCETCRWWGRERAHDYDHPYGTCRRRAPTFGRSKVLPYHDPDRPSAAGPLISQAQWYWAAFDDWCGEWQAPPPRGDGLGGGAEEG